MDSSTLVTLEDQKARALITALDAAGIEVRSAFWLYVPEASEWRLVLAMPLVERHGPRAGYEAVEKELRRQQPLPTELPLRLIQVVAPNDPLVSLIRRVVKTPPRALGNVRFTNNVVNGVLIPDAYIYRST